MHPANESTPLNAVVLACQVASVRIYGCAVAKGHDTRDAIPAVSKQRFVRSKDGKPHPRSAPGQQRHPARRQVSRPPSRISGNISLCGPKGSCTTISDRVGVTERRCPRSRSGNPSPECTGQRKHPAQRRFPGPPSRFSGNGSLCGRKGSCTTMPAGARVMKHRCLPPRSETPSLSPRQSPRWALKAASRPGETAQAYTTRHQGGPWYHSYAWIPRGLRCGPWSGQERAFGTWTRMGVFLAAICCTYVKDAVGWAVYVGDVRQHLDRPHTGPGGSGRAWHATTPPWERVEPAPAERLCQRRRSPSLSAALETQRARVRATGGGGGDNIQVVAA